MFKKINNYHLFILILIVFILNTILFRSINMTKAQGWEGPSDIPGAGDDINIVTSPLSSDLDLGSQSIIGEGNINVEGTICDGSGCINMFNSGAYYTQLVSSNELNLYNDGNAAMLYINHNTNSNANSDVDISHGTLTVYGTGGINVDGGIRNNGIFESTQSVYNTGTSEWTNIGTWSNAQGGETLVLRYYGGRGYNNNLSQNVNTEIHLRRSWDGSCDAICVEGYYYDWGGGTDEQILDVSVVQIGGNHASTFDVYVYVNAYSGLDFWEALHDSSSDFVWNNTVTSDPETGSNIRNLQKTVSFQNGLLNINKDLGTVSVGGDLTTSGNITAPGFFYSSDKQLKKDIRKINNPLDKIMQLEGVSFKWQEDNEESLGLIAQDVEKVFPELVSTNNEGLKTVAYGNLIAPLIEALKAQDNKIEKLSAQINLENSCFLPF